MHIEFIDTLIKLISIYTCVGYTFFKIIGFSKISKTKLALIFTFSIILAFFEIFLKSRMSSFWSIVFVFFSNSIILSIISEKKLGFSLVTNIISLSISYSIFCIATFIVFFFSTILKITPYNSPMNFLIISFLQYGFNYILFKIRRLKTGIPFIRKQCENDYLDIFVLIVSTVMIFVYFLIGNYKNIYPKYLYLTFILFTVLMIIVLRKSFILYQKQKLLTKTLKEYETELTQTKEKLQTALQEKHTLVKSNHEFYHRQEALKQKLNTLIQTVNHSYSTETADEIAQIQDRINTLSEEYTKNTKTKISLPKTHIPELDDMFSYMQSECEKNNIEFILKLNNDINYMLENIIPKNKLETLIGDLLRNAIIAINHSKNEYKSIMAILGIKDNFFEFCVHDSGVDFEISTLLKLGTEPATTHKYSGGTGIGFITTFETLDYCNASIIINENPKSTNNYTKSIIIRFDNNHNYIINSYRADEISNSNNINRTIIVNDIKI